MEEGKINVNLKDFFSGEASGGNTPPPLEQAQKIDKKTLSLIGGKYNIKIRNLKKKQREFVKEYLNIFLYIYNVQHKKAYPRINTVIDICKKLNIPVSLPYYWAERDKEFEEVFKYIKGIRERVFNDYAEATIKNNVLKGKEVSLIFYLKNRLSDRWKDDHILNKVYLETKELNFNFVKTTVNNLSNDALLEKAKELSDRLSHLNSTTLKSDKNERG